MEALGYAIFTLFSDAATAGFSLFGSATEATGGSVMKFLFVLVCIVYILSPVDFLPDAIPVVGTADDGLAGILAGIVLNWGREQVVRREVRR